MRGLRLLPILALVACLLPAAYAQGGSLMTPQNGGPDPLSIGETALAKHDNASALAFFSRYTSENPKDVRARLLLGGTHLQMNDAKAAAEDFRQAIVLDPDYWPAHFNLVVADALAGDWTGFDAERGLLTAARDANRPGLSKDGHDTIDILSVDGKTYHAWAFYKLNGKFHTRYLFVHNGPDGKPLDWIQCESDDADQMFFQQKHAKEAAAGARSFSLDTYSLGANGTVSQGLIKFYMDGEPTYEQVRADVLSALNGRSQPSAASTGAAPPNTKLPAAKPHP